MTKVITKEKGDTGLIQIIADLNRQNIKVALPISEHLPFDLIAINSEGKLSKVSVKYKSLNKSGAIAVPLRSISTNMRGWKAKTINFNDIDGIAIYCPDNGQSYYISSKNLIKYKSSFFLRVKECNHKKCVNLAKNYTNYNVLFE